VALERIQSAVADYPLCQQDRPRVTLTPEAIAIERTIRITILAFLKSSSICICSKDCCENHRELHLVDYVDVLLECADTDLELDGFSINGRDPYL
jgi:hypothetical protein